MSVSVPLEYAQSISELVEGYAVYQRQPSGRYAVERYPSLLTLLADPANSGGSTGAPGAATRVPLSLDVVDLKSRYGIKDVERYRSLILGKLATSRYTVDDLTTWQRLHQEIRALFYPPVKEFTSQSMACPACGEQAVHGEAEPDLRIWCTACMSTWTKDDYVQELMNYQG